jgi:hypothetical protein
LVGRTAGGKTARGGAGLDRRRASGGGGDDIGAVFVLPAVAGPVLTSVTDPVWAITALTALAFFLPSFFAGVPAPVLAQIAVTTQEDSGPALGAMFASGAVGAIAGTLLAGFVFIAWLGST